jgi:hypothetical protein
LLLIVAALVVARIVLPPSPAAPAIVEAVPRGAPAQRTMAASGSAPAISRAGDATVDQVDVPGNAFAVPVVAPPPAPLAPVAAAPTAPRPVAQIQPVVAAPVPDEPPLPLQVIGTYDDGGTRAIFLATPSGTLIVREGSLVLDDYRITQITRQNVSLTRVSTQRSLQLPIPNGAGS